MKIGQIQILLAIAFFVTLLSVYVTHRNVEQKKESTSLLIHTQYTIQTTEELLALVTDAETGQRGYILTADTAYLQPYLLALNKIQDKIHELRQLTARMPRQQKRLDSLQMHITSKIDELNYTVNLFNTKGIKPTLDVIRTDRGRLAMDEARILVQAIIAEEGNNLALYNIAMEKTYQLADQIRYGSLGFIAFMLAVSYFTLARKQKNINRLIKELNSVNRNLEEEIKTRTLELQEANQELVSVNEELHSTNDQLTAVNEEKNTFIGMAAHDLKSPINSIKGLVDLFQMEQDNLTEEQKEYLRYISSSSIRMLRLISDILNVNKIEEGKSTLRLEKFNIYDFVENLVFGLKLTAEQKNIKMQLTANTRDMLVESDKDMIAQILENLISNAIKFSPPDRRIMVRVMQEQNQLCLSIADQGQGIKSTELPHLFDKFTRISTRPTAGEDSTGLGLSIVKGLVEKLHGDISVESEENVGSTFTVKLPLSIKG
jgi:signal transduction histidine kinase